MTAPFVADAEALREALRVAIEACLEDPEGRDVDVEADDLADLLLTSGLVQPREDAVRSAKDAREALEAAAREMPWRPDWSRGEVQGYLLDRASTLAHPTDVRMVRNQAPRTCERKTEG